MIRCPSFRPLRLIVFGVFAGLAMACSPAGPGRLVDLTHHFDRETIYWPGNKPFQWERTDWGETAGGYWYAAAVFAASEHGGTHMDAPLHFGRGRQAVDQIPLERLTGPAVVVDVRPQCRKQRDYELTVADLQAWEARHGTIPGGAIVLMLSGWGRHWPDRAAYLGSQTEDPHDLHFPGFSAAAAEFLVAQRHVSGLGIDTASIDPGRSRDFPVHRIVGVADVYGLENVAALDQLPPVGATIWALPLKIRGGSGGPVRIIAVLP